eukprot:CAMPEP_0202973274 /NCGR_PEP_ID=MMETSP1396-20130829/48404_1 /ASSEMBLY_ACC=CAM_ASM_000872 /TAXON_ID= /ORGANISM="Pseudokeronopsis sp., Strain Brazil" /LENGTH=40 /DNA_ID= /DNA_START= /DNA_END= /DNA_ORIENTATION=
MDISANDLFKTNEVVVKNILDIQTDPDTLLFMTKSKGVRN